LDELVIDYRIHVDGAYGGYIYPFVTDNDHYTFKNSKVFSFSLDGHKMLQSPYGTGIYLVRKGYIHHAITEEANYVKGKDYTLVGSRSGANAIAVWMIMRTYGSDGWKAKINHLMKRTSRLCDDLTERGVEYFRNPKMNIITIKAKYISSALAAKYLLVPDSHDDAKWYKIVIMDHVTQGFIDRFLNDLDG
jgi:tyrosine decarboxylase/aspartate 1-decarboxylase